MEAVAAVSLAGNIVGFIDFGSKLVAQIQEISDSASGASQDNSDMAMLVNDLSSYVEQLKRPNTSTVPTEKEERLWSLALRCAVLAKELAVKLKKLTVAEDARFKRLSSIGKALRSVWAKKDLGDKMAMLNEFRSEFQLNILISLR